MVRLIGIIQVYFLFKQSQRVSDKEMSNMLGQEVVNACKERSPWTHYTAQDSTVLQVPKEDRTAQEVVERVSRSSGNGWFVRYSHLTQDLILRALGRRRSFIRYLHNACWGTGGDLDTDLQSKFLLLKVKKISQVFGTWNFRNKQPPKKS